MYGEILGVGATASPTSVNGWPSEPSGIARAMRLALADAALHRDIEDVSIEHHDIHRRGGPGRGTDALCTGAGRLQGSMAAVDDPLSQRHIPFGDDNHDVEVGSQRIGEGEHPLEVSEANTAAAVGGEQRPWGHDATACAAAHACIRWRAMTTSS